MRCLLEVRHWHWEHLGDICVDVENIKDIGINENIV
jgi:hypothetical protein